MKAFHAAAQRLQSSLTEAIQFDGTCEAARAAVRQWQQKCSATQASPQHLTARVQQLQAQAKASLRAAVSAALVAASALPAASTSAGSSAGGGVGSGGAGGAVQKLTDEAERAAQAALQDAVAARSECQRICGVVRSAHVSAAASAESAASCAGLMAAESRAPPSVSSLPPNSESKTDVERGDGSGPAIEVKVHVPNGSSLSAALRDWQSELDESWREVQRLCQRWREASAARDSAVRAQTEAMLAARPMGATGPWPAVSVAAAATTSSAGRDRKDAKGDAIVPLPSKLVHAVSEAMHELLTAVRDHTPALQSLLSDVQQKLQTEQNAFAEWRQTTSEAVTKRLAEYEPVVTAARAHVQSLTALRDRWEQYDGWRTAYRSKPPKAAVKRLAILKAEQEHADSPEELAQVTEQISQVNAALREYRVRWRAARDRLTDCLHSGYFADLEKDETLKYMLLPDR
jgi:hypothetical protein